MSAFKEITFRQASIDDISKIIDFIDKYWKKNHILARDREFFMYEHVSVNKVNFYIAISNTSKQIVAIQGFIPYGEYPGCHICGVISRVHPNSKIPLLGVELMKRMLSFTKPQTYCGIGTDPKTMLPLVKRFFSRSVGKLEHYLVINRVKKYFDILSNSGPLAEHANQLHSEKIKTKVSHKLITRDELIENFEKIFVNHHLPKKSAKYLLKRYFDHPKYDYLCYLINKENSSSFDLLVCRKITHNFSSALRVIDFIGDIKTLGMLQSWVDEMFSIKSYEYIDLLCTGIEDDILAMSGFLNKKNYDDLIVPTYFEPFVNDNIDIHFEKSDKELILFKGDADGDRPSS